MQTKNLDCKIIIEIKDQNIEIDQLDIAFNIRKNCKLEPDIAYIKIWNLDDTTYNYITENNSDLQLYIKSGNSDKTLLFCGKPDLETIRRENRFYPWKSPDICTVIKITDSADAYINSYINKDYIDSVSSTRIINDCINEMGLTINGINNITAEKMYDSYKAKGNPHTILKNICDELDIPLFIQNGVVRSFSGFDINNLTAIKEFNPGNASRPLLQNQSEVSFYSEFVPYLLPADIIKCSFEEFSGYYRISEITFDGNNYNKMCVTKITIGL